MPKTPAPAPAASPTSDPKKPGRPPNGPRAMTPAERQRAYRRRTQRAAVSAANFELEALTYPQLLTRLSFDVAALGRQDSLPTRKRIQATLDALSRCVGTCN